MSAAVTPEPGGAIVRILGPVGTQQAAEIYRQALVHLSRRAGLPLICDIRGAMDLTVVDVLARLEVMTRRHRTGLRIRTDSVEGATIDQLPLLLGFLGLAGTFADRLEPGGQAESGE